LSEISAQTGLPSKWMAFGIVLRMPDSLFAARTKSESTNLDAAFR